jgi:HlyD family secretion protein
MSDPQPPPKRRPPKFLIPVVLILLGAGAYWAYRNFLAPAPLPSNVLTMTGRIEGDDAAIAAKAPGRILELLVREGDEVKAGDLLARLDDEQIRAREQQAQSAVDQAMRSFGLHASRSRS